MNIDYLTQENDYCWSLSTAQTRGAPAKLFGSRQIINDMDEKVLEQIINVARLPGIIGAAMTMPDAHWGYGFPIGGVAAFDANQGGIISAGGVGFDISCGIRCLRTNLFLPDLLPYAEKLADTLLARIPAGVGSGSVISCSIQQIDEVMLGGAQWAVKRGYGLKDDLEYIEANGCMSGAKPEFVSERAKERQQDEMGSLGSGNHYLEIQVVDHIYLPGVAHVFGITSGQLLISIHCGSRGLGHQIGSDYLISLAKAAKRLGIELPDRELACAPILSEEGQAYIGAMNSGINCALANRQIITHLTRQIINEVLPQANIETLYDVSHNTCKYESHQIEGMLRKVYVHRKGATRAFGPNHPDLPERYRQVGQPVIIGGSMGTASYLLVGADGQDNPAFASASHGAGRGMSRRQALKRWSGRELVQHLSQKGILIRSQSMRGIAEEAPGAYKDVDEVALATEKAKLALRVARLRPVLCVEG